ncbi:MAG: Na+/H+ antiporter subunit G [Stappia sp.]|uniref:monovalent cation/H(+) antiporter subunit G n=1 Tax=Stappia sp. TaxID=1870903 RepID=UPI000C3AF270|nr:monovalent cation/H(+) antiporter subunit G [Stappia sp.]MAA99825.1 Na+/H+ antiporter subunit G [Stappia sp.]MBM22298.1 Na+/H+ antiporter subunit G [Stappia sp.]
MTTPLFEIAVGIVLVIGSLFSLIAAIGLLRLKDVYMRMHAGSKAGTLGSGLMLIALAVHAHQIDVITRAIAGVVFFLLTAPVAAHLLAKAALEVGYRPCADTKIDEMPRDKA